MMYSLLSITLAIFCAEALLFANPSKRRLLRKLKEKGERKRGQKRTKGDKRGEEGRYARERRNFFGKICLSFEIKPKAHH
jgi:hypothetical protein